MKKLILLAFGGIVIVVVIVLVLGVSNLGPLIEKAVNTYGPGIAKTELRVEDVKVSVFSGEAELKNFLLGNPEGFDSKQAMKVGAIRVNVNKKTLTEDTIVIDRIEIVRPDITYEKKRGTDNFKTILNNVTKSVSTDKPKKARTEKEDAGKKIVISDFIVTGGKVNLVMPGLGGKSVTAALPDIHLKDVGKEKGGASPAEAAKEIFAALYEKIASPAVADILNKHLKALSPNIEGAGESVKKELGGITDKMRGLLGN